MNRFISIPVRMSLMVFATVAVLQTGAHSGSLDERFKVSLNAVIHKVTATEDPAAKRKMLGNFLSRMDLGIGMAKNFVSEKEGKTLDILGRKVQADYAELNGIGTAKVPDAALNSFAGYVQQDVEQADAVIYIGGGFGFIVLLLILLILLR